MYSLDSGTMWALILALSSSALVMILQGRQIGKLSRALARKNRDYAYMQKHYDVLESARISNQL